MLGGSTLGIGVTMFLRDQFSGPAARIRSNAKYLEADLLKMEQARMRQQSTMYAGMAIAGAMALRGLGRMVKKSAEFTYEMEFVRAITQATGDEQLRLSKIAKTLGRETMFFPQQIAEGMRFMAMAGMSAIEVEKNITGAVQLAGATKSQLGGVGGAADIMTNVMKQFQVDFKYTSDIADLLSYGTTRANMNLFQLGEALKYAGATAMDLNITLGESVAMTMALGNAGLQGSMAGVAMENAMRYMSRAVTDFGSGPSKKAISMLGMTMRDFTDEKGNLLSMVEIIQNMGIALEGAYAGTGNAEKQAILQSIFGVRGKRAGSLLIRNLKEFQRFANETANVEKGYAQGIMTDMMNTLQGHMYKLGSTWEAMWVSFTDRITPVLMFFMRGLIKVLGLMERLFSNKFFGGFFAVGIAGFLLLKTVTWAYKAVVWRLRLVHSIAASSAAMMAAATNASYTSMTASALAYAAAAKAGHLSMMGLTAGVAAGGAKGLMVNKAGRIISSKTKRYVGGAAAMGLLAKGAGKGAVAGAVGSTALKTGARFGIGRLVGILGGPWGMVISAAMFVLPALLGGIINAVNGSKKATESNSEALRKKRMDEISRSQEFSRMGHAIKFFDLISPEARISGTTGPEGNVITGATNPILNSLGSAVMDKANNPNVILNINLDGETLFSKQLEDFFSKKEDYANHSISIP